MSLCPGRRRSRSGWMSASESGRRGGHPSITTPTPPPCDSPQVEIRNKVPKLLAILRYKKPEGRRGITRIIAGEARKWGDRRDSNPQQPGPQPGALPLSYDHHIETQGEGYIGGQKIDGCGDFVNADLGINTGAKFSPTQSPPTDQAHWERAANRNSRRTRNLPKERERTFQAAPCP